jgi:L-lactate dehydrogenase complex protein LldG
MVAGAGMTAEARSEILARVRRALADVPSGEAAGTHDYQVASSTTQALASAFVERVEDYRANVTQCGPETVRDAVRAICDRQQARRLAIPPAVPTDWLPDDLDVVRDEPPLGSRELELIDGALTGSSLGIAETGTLALDGGPLSGRRVVSLLPDLHICVVQAGALVATVHDAIGALAAVIGDCRPVTLISGPSATSDIELTRVEGVHGPRRLEVVLVRRRQDVDAMPQATRLSRAKASA